MPRSKRARIVHESKVTKKSHKEQTRRLYANVRECVENYDHLFVFSVDNMRNTYLKDVRTEFADSRLFFGKTKVMAVALGHNPETEAAPNLHKLSPYLTGAVGLLFTSRDPESVLSYFDAFRPSTSPVPAHIPNGLVYSRAGEIPASEDEPVSHTIEPELRKLGVPTRLVKGKVMLELTDGQEGYPICKEGEVLDSRQTTLLKMFGVATAEFKVDLKAQWTRSTGEVTILEKDEGMEVDGQ
ncbi:ribosome assembly factor MRT4 [Aspergillus novofumigatus IBT 16806]|uniref:Ribosome assembly factor mrt4 n=1 Tax=Aspergillus novofumigatus (strain IBT 16806) TaxID=1392255 RepID=A0A2I1CJ71_ASPN1|nr:putative 60S acidic ribosomal protein P0 [Aspergillus novofumigatus IBT 16806]PKX97644.1 putative 60S acidic ribosomal protein P0 [Aspergillus novofumigatus IBT 16806]